MRSSKLAVGAVLVFFGLNFAGTCGGGDLSTEDTGDLKTRCRTAAQTNCLDDSQKRVIANANHFPNIALACDGFGHRIYTTTGKHLTIIADPTCPGWTPDTPKMGVITDGAK